VNGTMAAFNMTAMRTALHHPCRLQQRSTPVSRISAPAPFAPLTSLNSGLRKRIEPVTDAGMLQCPSNGATVFAMRHRKKLPKLNRPADQRKALLRSLTTEILRHGKITTTKVKAKAVRKYVDKMIQLAKDGSLHARRQALAYIYDKDIVKSLFEEAPKRYGDRNGGYCRVVTEDRLRRGDAAEMAIIELVA